jgi:hypothetical protein
LACAGDGTSWDEFTVAGDAVVLVERGDGGQRLVRVALSPPALEPGALDPPVPESAALSPITVGGP